MTNLKPDVSVIIVSFQTRELTRRCLETVRLEARGLAVETIVADNASSDGSPEMLSEDPSVRLIRLDRNIGFGPANNRALAVAQGRYFVLLNSDAFLQPYALVRAVEHMDRTPSAGAGGARLLSEDGTDQPSAWRFPSPLRDLLVYSGMAARFPKSACLSGGGRRWADASQEALVDWVPGAFLILRPEALDKVGFFDEQFFLYYEEVDLCRRLKHAGYSTHYWPDIQVVHLGGESAKKLGMALSPAARQVALWRFRSEWMYYRKHHPRLVWLARLLESSWLAMRRMRNTRSSNMERRAKAAECEELLHLATQAWKDTAGGRISPAL